MRGCDGCFCHEYDHIVPFSKGGQSIQENCQILQQRVNRFKGNEDNHIDKLKSYSCEKNFNARDLDILEMALYGDVRDGEGKIKCRCKSALEMESDDSESGSDTNDFVAAAEDEDSESDHVKTKTKTKKKKNKGKNKRKLKPFKAEKKRVVEQARPPKGSNTVSNCK